MSCYTKVIEDSGNYHLYQRWGRTGSSGQKKLTSDLNAAGAFKVRVLGLSHNACSIAHLPL